MIILFIVEKNVVPSVVKNDTINEIKNKYSMKRGNFQYLNEQYSQSFTAEGLEMRRSISTVYIDSTKEISVPYAGRLMKIGASVCLLRPGSICAAENSQYMSSGPMYQSRKFI